MFVIATANNVQQLPPELLRKGRFDEIFFFDLPTDPERRSIWDLQLSKRLRNAAVAGDLQRSDRLLADLSTASDGYSGAEIEQAVIAALFDAFADRRALRRDDLLRAVENMVPLSVTQAEQIQAIRTWANVRAVAATAAEDRNDQADWMEEFNPAPRPPQDPPAAHPLQARGGRAVDF